MLRYFIYLVLVAAYCATEPAAEQKPATDADPEEPPEGYYAFVESPNATPPRVRPPPYRQVAADCAGAGDARAHVSAGNLCGDLNRGLIPRNPLGQSPNGEPYPFELIRNHTLRFLSRTLPVLRADDALPRVAHVPADRDLTHNRLEEREKRSILTEAEAKLRSNARAEAELRTGRDEAEPPTGARAGRSNEPRKSARGGRAEAELRPEHRADDARDTSSFCAGGGVFCMLYRAINGESAGPERREDPGLTPNAPHAPPHKYEGPPTPCPARVEYATPVFARNYQGVWRYVVQIPYEGYFTQTVEVTRCMQARCHYLDGGCLSSPRWVSLLVAELHYPPASSTAHPQETSAGVGTTASGGARSCDGQDEFGCYQVRLYYDWFLVPGSCKCWRPDYFARYVRRAARDDRGAGDL